MPKWTCAKLLRFGEAKNTWNKKWNELAWAVGETSTSVNGGENFRLLEKAFLCFKASSIIARVAAVAAKSFSTITINV